MLIHEIQLRNILSFGPEVQKLDLRPLNVLIGPNGAGKSNLIEVIGLLQAAPRNLPAPIRESGGVDDWVWRSDEQVKSASVEIVLENLIGQRPLHYALEFASNSQRFEVIYESLRDKETENTRVNPEIYFNYQNRIAAISYRDPSGTLRRTLRLADFTPDQSILAQRKDPDHFPELTYIGDKLDKIRLYREWSFGRNIPLRWPQKSDLPNDYLAVDGSNLGLILNKFKRSPRDEHKFLKELREFGDGVTDFGVIIEGGTIQVFLREGNVIMPATRLSDGTLRYLCLLAILCHPNPSPLVCIEEPELGLHPDLLPSLATLLQEASEKCQLIVTTHSDILVDALTETAESIVVCEKHDGQTRLDRLDERRLTDWLKKYRLGELWVSGELGGNRW